jgi:hypothetical protein
VLCATQFANPTQPLATQCAQAAANPAAFPVALVLHTHMIAQGNTINRTHIARLHDEGRNAVNAAPKRSPPDKGA